MEYSVSGFSDPKQDAATRSAGCTTMQSSAYKLADTDHSARVPPSKSPLRSEFTPVFNSLPDHSSAVMSVLPAATEPASPSSPMCSMPSPPSPLSLTHSQENCPPGDHESHELQPCHDDLSTPDPSRILTAGLLEEPCAADVEHNNQQHADPQPASCDAVSENGSDPPSGDLANAAVQQAHGSAPHVMFYKPPQADSAAAASLTQAAAEAVPRMDAGQCRHLQHPSCDATQPQADERHKAVASTSQAVPAEPWCCDQPTCGADVRGSISCHPAATRHVAEDPARPPRINRAALIRGRVTPPAVPGAFMPSCADQPGTSCAALPAVSSVNASPTPQQLDSAAPLGAGALATSCTGGWPVAACLELQQELDRHAMPPPKPKRARAQQPDSEEERQEKRACEAAGFWNDVWSTPRSDAGGPPLFQDPRYHLPLFHPSASLPSGNAWMLTFLP